MQDIWTGCIPSKPISRFQPRLKDMCHIALNSYQENEFSSSYKADLSEEGGAA